MIPDRGLVPVRGFLTLLGVAVLSGLVAATAVQWVWVTVRDRGVSDLWKV